MEDKMEIIQYFESIRRAYGDEDTEKLTELREKYGKDTVTMDEVERLVAYVFQTMAQFQVAMEEKSQIQFDMIVNSLEAEDILSSRGLYQLREADDKLNKQLEEGIGEAE